MAFCENCGAPHGNGKYCGGCGSPLPEPPAPGSEETTKTDSASSHSLGAPPTTDDKASSAPSSRRRLLKTAGAGMGALAIAGTAYFGLQFLQSPPPPPTELVATITAPDGGFGAAGAFLPDGSALYVASERGLTVVDPRINEAVRTITVGADFVKFFPQGLEPGVMRVLASRDASGVYALSQEFASIAKIGTEVGSGATEVFLHTDRSGDLAATNHQELGVLQGVIEPGLLVDAVLSTDDSFLYVAVQSAESNYIAVLDAESLSLVESIEVTASMSGSTYYNRATDLQVSLPNEVLATTTQGSLFLGSSGSISQNMVVEIDTSANAVLREYSASQRTSRLTLNPLGAVVYASDAYNCSDSGADDGSLRIDVESNTAVMTDICVVGAVPGAEQMFGYTAQGSLAIIDAKTDNVLRTIPVPTSSDMLIVRRGMIADAYIADRETDTVTVVPGDGDAALATIPVGDAPHPIASAPDGSSVYFSNLADGTISVIGRS